MPSPTFTLVQTYDAPLFEIYHFDLYRLKNAEEIWELNMEEALNTSVCLIEWPEKMGAYLPQKALRLYITAQNSGRRIDFFVPEAEKARFMQAARKPDFIGDEN